MKNAAGQEVSWKPRGVKDVEVYRANETELRSGDKIRWTRNVYQDGKLKYTNGQTAEVKEVNEKDLTATVSYQGKEHRISTDQEQYLKHAYCRTTRTAQGTDEKRAIVEYDVSDSRSINRESALVDQTRGKDRVTNYTSNSERVGFLAEHRSGAQKNVLEEIGREERKQQFSARGPATERGGEGTGKTAGKAAEGASREAGKDIEKSIDRGISR